MESEMWEEGAR